MNSQQIALSRCIIVSIAVLLCLFLLPRTAYGHNLSDGFVSVEQKDGTLSGQIELALRDLEYALGVDVNGDTTITWGEILLRQKDLERYVRDGFSIEKSNGGTDVTLPLTFGPLRINRRSDGSYAVFSVTAPAESLAGMKLRYNLLFPIDPQHRGIISISRPEGSQLRVAAPGAERVELDAANAGALNEFAVFFAEGVHHILAGYDHMLFLLALLLPAVLVRNVVQHSWNGVRTLRPALSNTLKVVTAFTVAHSITLALATLEVVQPPPRLIEALIAVSIIAAAGNNLFPVVTRREWMLTFAFGLIHGFGFANVLKDMALSRGHFAMSLAGFNLGVEAGQLALVVTLLPVLFVMRDSVFYRRGVLSFGSLSIVGLATVWLIERSLNVSVLGF